MRRVLLALAVLAAPLSGPAAAQDRGETLADIRQELVVLSSEINRLRRELSTTGAPSVQLPASALQRIDALEAEVRRLAAQTEEISGRVEAVVRDGTNRIGDLEFQLTELGGGDLSQLGDPQPLGGEISAPAAPAPATPIEGPELAMGEQADFTRAQEAFDAGNWTEAAQLLGQFVDAYPGGPMTGRATYLRGRALEATGDQAGAARAYLSAFSGEPNGGDAPDALFRLATMLRDLGQSSEACITFGEVQTRFPGTGAEAEARSAAAAAGCQ